VGALQTRAKEAHNHCPAFSNSKRSLHSINKQTPVVILVRAIVGQNHLDIGESLYEQRFTERRLRA